VKVDRIAQYHSILEELDKFPEALDTLHSRAKARIKRQARIRGLFAAPLSSAAVFAAIFIAAVNLFTPFALACGRIPLIRELAAAAAFSPSLSAAVKNEYVQPIDLEQTKNGITMRLEYAIVDQKQLNIFYTVKSSASTDIDATPAIMNSDGTPLEQYAISSGRTSGDQMRLFTIDFNSLDVPSSLLLNCSILAYKPGDGTYEAPVPIDSPPEAEAPESSAEFSFILSIDPSRTAKGETIPLNREISLDGQSLTIESAEIYPTHIRINVSGSPSNTAWLKSLGFYLENGHGERFDAIANGIAATGSTKSPEMASYRLESAFFSNSKGLTLHIASATWLDKGMERLEINLKDKSSPVLPQGVVFEQAVLIGSSWHLVFSAPLLETGAMHQIFLSDYQSPDGEMLSMSGWSHTTEGFPDKASNEHAFIPGRFAESITLEDYPYDAVLLSPSYSRIAELPNPVVVEIK
jgi:hypothetical protein